MKNSNDNLAKPDQMLATPKDVTDSQKKTPPSQGSLKEILFSKEVTPRAEIDPKLEKLAFAMSPILPLAKFAEEKWSHMDQNELKILQKAHQSLLPEHAKA